MVSFGSIDFNKLKGHNPVMASGPNAWVPRQHRFVWANGLQPDKEAHTQIIYNYNTLISGNVQPMRRGQMNHFRDLPDEPFEPVDVIRSNLNSVKAPVWQGNNQPVQYNMSMGRPAVTAMPAWNLFNHKARKAGCGSCGGRG